MSFDSLPNGFLKTSLSRYDGSFIELTEFERSLLNSRHDIRKIEKGSLWDFNKELAAFWGIPAPNLYRQNRIDISGKFLHDSCSIVIRGPYNVYQTGYAQALAAHEFFHGMQGELFETMSKAESLGQIYAKLAELQADLYAAAVTSVETTIRGLERFSTKKGNNTHPPRAERIQNIIEARKSPEWETWVERHDRESLTELLKLPFERE